MFENERDKRLIEEMEQEEEKFWQSLIDEMADSQWMDEVIKHRIDSYNSNLKELDLNQKYNENFPDLDYSFDLQDFMEDQSYQDYLIEQTLEEVKNQDEYLKIIEDRDFQEKHLDSLIKEYLEKEDEFNRMIKEAIDEEYYFQEYVEEIICEYDERDYHHDYFSMDESDFYYYETPEKDPFDSFDDNVDYMSMGIYEGANTDHLEEPYSGRFEEPVPEIYFVEPDYDECMEMPDYDIDEPEDLIIVDSYVNEDKHIEELIASRILEEKLIEKAFREYIKEEDRIEKIIREQITNNEKLNNKIEGQYYEYQRENNGNE